MNKRRRRQERKREAQRGNFIPTSTFRAEPYTKSILALEDRRYFAPAGTYPRAQFHRSPVIVVSPNRNKDKSNVVPHKVRFAVPKEVSLCVRRKQRRQVLFALNKRGKGSRARRRHRSEFSDVKC